MGPRVAIHHLEDDTTGGTVAACSRFIRNESDGFRPKSLPQGFSPTGSRGTTGERPCVGWGGGGRHSPQRLRRSIRSSGVGFPSCGPDDCSLAGSESGSAFPGTNPNAAVGMEGDADFGQGYWPHAENGCCKAHGASKCGVIRQAYHHQACVIVLTISVALAIPRGVSVYPVSLVPVTSPEKLFK